MDDGDGGDDDDDGGDGDGDDDDMDDNSVWNSNDNCSLSCVVFLVSSSFVKCGGCALIIVFIICVLYYLLNCS